MENQAELSILTAKLEQTLAGRARPIQDAIVQLERTGSLLDDFILPTQGLQFLRREEKNDVGLTFKPEFYPLKEGATPAIFGLHDHALDQIAFKMNIPQGYLKNLTRGSEWQKDLSQTIMQSHANNSTRERVMLRTVEGQVRGFVSDHYRRLNSMEIFMAFLMAAQLSKSVLVDAHSGETKGFLEVINPNIIEFDTPLNGRSYAAIGARIRNSDFGDGALEVYQFAIMVKCMNGLVGNSMLKEFHLGGRIPDNIQISEDTYKKDTVAKAALVRDIMKQINMAETTDGLIAKIRGASAKEINLVKEVEHLPKLGLTLAETESVGRVLMENNPDNGLEGSPTLWKLVQGLTAVARESTPERKRELELIAGNMI
jgi:hypothetical protein